MQSKFILIALAAALVSAQDVSLPVERPPPPVSDGPSSDATLFTIPEGTGSLRPPFGPGPTGGADAEPTEEPSAQPTDGGADSQVFTIPEGTGDLSPTSADGGESSGAAPAPTESGAPSEPAGTEAPPTGTESAAPSAPSSSDNAAVQNGAAMGVALAAGLAVIAAL